MTVLLVVLFAGIVGLTVWGWVTLGDQRMNVSVGIPPSVEGTTGKKTWLLLHLAAATVVFVSCLALGDNDDVPIEVIGPLLLAYFLFAEWLGIRKARRFR